MTSVLQPKSVFQPKHAVVPVSLEGDEELDFAKRALTAAATIVKGSGEGLITVVTVRVPLDAPGSRLPFAEDTYDAYRSILVGREKWADHQLDELARFARELGVKANAHAVPDKDGVANELIDDVKKLGADLIVMTTHSRTGIKRLFLGSVAQRVAHLSPVPVLLLPPK